VRALNARHDEEEEIMSVTGILGKKIGMTQLFDDRGDIHPVTVLKVGPCVITQLKTLAKDGYEDDQTAKAGDRITVEIFSETKFVDVIGNSKGRGFAGVVRRHGFGGGPKSHGHMFQVQGSIGASSFPSRVFPGQRMPGHMGTTQVTVRNLRIRGIDVEDNLLLVEGAVPGARDGYVLVSKAKAPPRERRGFAGAETRDALKASKKAAAGKK
jgi:large subunit ribosomal protein L3